MTDKTTVGCQCSDCASIHSEFISVFGRWPNMSHDDAAQLKQNRIDNLRSWDKLERGYRR